MMKKPQPTCTSASKAIAATGMPSRAFWAAMARREIPCHHGEHGCTWNLEELERLRDATCVVTYDEALRRTVGRRGWLSWLPWRRQQ